MPSACFTSTAYTPGFSASSWDFSTVPGDAAATDPGPLVTGPGPGAGRGLVLLLGGRG
ncbi:hypothetical protein [Streptomyces griseorubiginosus]|uniref:hypothetical protein n=1 Tax=Streptomyces griseorubiginosus TaxID=67304 RepID=UPI00364BED25